MTDLTNRSVFLSASLPTRERRSEAGDSYSPSEISDAVTAIARMVLEGNGQVVCGGHPTISPLLFWLARELKRPGQIVIYQTDYFRSVVPEETWELADNGYASIEWTPDQGDREASLELMRRKMLSVRYLSGAVFIGGMKGIIDEFVLTGELRPGILRIPLGGPGGAARSLLEGLKLPEELGDVRESRRYPYLASLIVSALSEVSLQ